ncbi:class I SAM-dependent DNA methyltransferase [bacterium]|nr:class I SAM-dependent DNA methyltransferase [bacterium]
MNLSPQEFVAKWRGVTQKERSVSQSHFNDLCRLVGHATPIEADPTGKWFAFEAGADKLGGGQGWADVWMRGHFGWEYKGKHADLDKAYQQLLRYRESLQNPPLLIVSDIDRIVIHTNFTNTVKQVIPITFDDLLTPDGLRKLKDVFFAPDAFKSPQTTEAVTRQAAQDFAKLADLLRSQGHEPQRIAHFSIRLLFCLFAEDIGLLPDHIFSKMVDRTRMHPEQFTGLVRQLFDAMAKGGWFGMERIDHFNGGLFDDDSVLPLNYDGMDILGRVCRLDWSSIEPSILGTLFERSLDPSKRSQLGAHYTSKEDILLIVEPVLMAPLRRRWVEVQATARDLAAKRDQAGSRSAASRYVNELEKVLRDFADELAAVRVLDPACGSANFLYVALRQLLDLWKEVAVLGAELGLTMMLPLSGASPSPAQLYGIEINPYAFELAQATIWIGYIQWLHENGYGAPSEPILKLLDNIKNMDAVLAFDADGKPYEPEWPAADVIVGNPPFLGGNKVRQELGDEYVNALFALYDERVPAFADFVCYWFERARKAIADRALERAGLLATNSIRGGANREVLERIKQSGDIFMAWSDRPWILDGAAVRVSMIGLDDGRTLCKHLNGSEVSRINADLTSTDADLSRAKVLSENEHLAYMGMSKKGPFDIPSFIAKEMLDAPLNPNRRPNSDVVRPIANGIDITRRPRGMWIIDFGTDASEHEASYFELPFEYLKTNVYPVRAENRRAAYRDRWWMLAESRPGLRQSIADLTRYIATPTVAKYRLFVWLDSKTVPDQQLIAVAREDDYFFGVLHSRPHELWSLRQGTSLEDRPRYTPTSTFETFPFPWPPGTEPTDDPRLQAIAQAAKELVEYRDNWLNPQGLPEKELQKRTLTNLYNAMPTWLKMAHEKLDNAVFDAYGWPYDLSDDEVLARLLALNLERATGERLL